MDTPNSNRAMTDFREARRKAKMQDIMARIKGQPADLLSFDDVSQNFRLEGGSARGVQDIPLDSIVGSVGRYQDFNRQFLPRRDGLGRRWASVQRGAEGLVGLPPIEAYKIGDVYFVVDGNHRVSVARQMESPAIQGKVTEFKTRIPISPEDSPDEIIIKSEYATFLEKTNLDHLRPDTDFSVTAPGRMWVLSTQIEAFHFLKMQESGQDIPYPEAVTRWHDEVYLPVIEAIGANGILRDFPGRTETDLYLWIFQHRAEMEAQLGWDVNLEAAALNLIAEQSDSTERVVARGGEKLLDWVMPDPLESGPAAGAWRRDWLAERPNDRLFGNLLVPISGAPESWHAVEAAIRVARHENGQLFGLHLVADTSAQTDGPALSIRDEFLRRCRQAGVPGSLSIETGNVARTVNDRARLADLVVLHLAHPPGSGPLKRLESGFRTLLTRCPRPVLAVPGPVASFNRALIAFDGSPKSREALFVSAYLANQARMELVVLTVVKNSADRQTLEQAQTYLAERGAAAEFVGGAGNPGDAILQAAADRRCDVIVMGGYGRHAAVQVMLGSAVDQVLRQSAVPVLICR